MKNTEVEDIVTSVAEAVRRAYALGRSDAMKRVVEMAQADDPGLRAVALLGPAEPAEPATPEPALPEPTPLPALTNDNVAAEPAMAASAERQSDQPWYRRSPAR